MCEIGEHCVEVRRKSAESASFLLHVGSRDLSLAIGTCLYPMRHPDSLQSFVTATEGFLDFYIVIYVTHDN